jgi:alpha-glucosidase
MTNLDIVSLRSHVTLSNRPVLFNYYFIGFSTAERTWLPVAEGFEHLNVANQRSAVRSHYQVYRTLTNLRFRPAFRLGRYESLALNKDVFAFKRYVNHHPSQILIVHIICCELR